MLKEVTAVVNNCPDYAEGKWIVATPFRTELWFYGAWDNKEDAERVAEAEDKIILRG